MQTKRQPKKWHERCQVFVEWEDDVCEPCSHRDCLVTNDTGVSHLIHKHATQSMWKVSNGPFFTGSEWYTFDDDKTEYKTFDEAIAAAFAAKE